MPVSCLERLEAPSRLEIRSRLIESLASDWRADRSVSSSPALAMRASGSASRYDHVAICYAPRPLSIGLLPRESAAETSLRLTPEAPRRHGRPKATYCPHGSDRQDASSSQGSTPRRADRSVFGVSFLAPRLPRRYDRVGFRHAPQFRYAPQFRSMVLLQKDLAGEPSLRWKLETAAWGHWPRSPLRE